MEPPEAPPVEVDVLRVQPKPLVITSDLPGRIEPVRVAEVRARVAGIVLKRNFTEGANVKAGQVLFQIDPAPFKVALARAQADVTRADAALEQAKAVVRRYEPLVKIEAVSQQDFDTAVSNEKTALAARLSSIAEVEAARLNLEYATVRAPISGRIGRALVTEGALVGQNETTPLATIQQLDPVYADFKQPVGDVLELQDALSNGKLERASDKVARITVTIDGTNRTRDGKLLFSDVTVDRRTGEVAVRGELPNSDGMLLPGMYVRVKVGQAVDPTAVLVPQRAIHLGTDGKSTVLVVAQDNVAQSRVVQTGGMYGPNWHVRAGLKPGEQVIVGGGATAGAKVIVKAASEPASAPQE